MFTDYAIDKQSSKQVILLKILMVFCLAKSHRMYRPPIEFYYNIFGTYQHFGYQKKILPNGMDIFLIRAYFWYTGWYIIQIIL